MAFQSFTIENNNAMNILHITILNKFPGQVLLAIPIYIWMDSAKLPSRVCVLFYTANNSMQESACFQNMFQRLLSNFWIFANLISEQMAFLCNFNLHFYIIRAIEHLFICLKVCISFVINVIKILFIAHLKYELGVAT